MVGTTIRRDRGLQDSRYLKLDGTNIPTANYNWTTSLTTTGNITATIITGTNSGVFGGTLTIASGSITDTTGLIDFDNENLTTTGTITGGTLTDGTATLTGGAWTGATYNGLTITTGVNTFTLTRGATDLIVNADCTINQDLSNTSSPTFNALTVTSLNGLTGIGCAANVLSLTCGTTDFSVSADCAINQNLNTTASPSFVTVTGTTSVVANTMTMATGSITDTTGAINFGNENLLTTGTLGAGVTTITDNAQTVTIEHDGTQAYIRSSTDRIAFSGVRAGPVVEDIEFQFHNGWTTISSNTGNNLAEWYMSFKLTDDYSITLGLSNDFSMLWETSGAQDYLRLGIDTGSAAQSGAIIIDDLGQWYGRGMPQAAFSNPTLGIHSGAAVNEETLYLQHDGTNGRIWTPTGKGDVHIKSGSGDIVAESHLDVIQSAASWITVDSTTTYNRAMAMAIYDVSSTIFYDENGTLNFRRCSTANIRSHTGAGSSVIANIAAGANPDFILSGTGAWRGHHKSSTPTAGISTSVGVTGDDGNPCTLEFEDGLLVSSDCPAP